MVYCGLQEGKHTRALTGQRIDEVITSLELPASDKCWKSMTTDNASNMKAACRVSELIDDDFGCFDHTLNLILKGGVDKVPYINKCIEKFKKLASTVHRSSLHLQRIKKSCSNLNQSGTTPCDYRKIIQPVDTRWNSLLMMIDSILDLKPALLEIKNSTRGADGPFAIVIPDENEFDLIKELSPILRKFADVCDFMSGENYPTICWVLQKINILQATLSQARDRYNVNKESTFSNHMSEYCLEMMTEIERRWPRGGCTDKVHCISHILHPGMKGYILVKNKTMDHWIEVLIDEEEGAPEAEVLDQGMIMDEDEEQMMVSQALAQERGSIESEKSPLAQEIIAYRRAGTIPLKADVLQYWKLHAKEFPMLA